MEIGPLVLDKKILKVFTIYGCGSHLGHVTSIMLIIFCFLVPKSLHTNLFKNGPVNSEKSKFQFSYVNDLGQEMTLTLNTHIP